MATTGVSPLGPVGELIFGHFFVAMVGVIMGAILGYYLTLEATVITDSWSGVRKLGMLWISALWILRKLCKGLASHYPKELVLVTFVFGCWAGKKMHEIVEHWLKKREERHETHAREELKKREDKHAREEDRSKKGSGKKIGAKESGGKNGKTEQNQFFTADVVHCLVLIVMAVLSACCVEGINISHGV
eukprot:gnl/TRDRNA2_/TRDRNA2_75559_c0_seq1.p1 gnl/TRDRNA2_/TRDRNA2_75559_c0~~gnl/TRDRNA2_/TRDRNA2_75559_c0_seq1.p1  ORF type:complete len:189 (-),score=9.88 gnl/TRDRNA2_/TRDRNA2_75559_c0_seq1:366-932(-)